MWRSPDVKEKNNSFCWWGGFYRPIQFRIRTFDAVLNRSWRLIDLIWWGRIQKLSFVTLELLIGQSLSALMVIYKAL